MELTRSEKSDGCIWIGLILAILAMLIFMAFNPSTSSTTPEKNDDGAMACTMAQIFVRRQLKAPSTAEFPTCRTMTITQSGSIWTVTSYVDAENSFGAMLRNSFLAEMEYRSSEKKWYPLDVQIFAP